MKFVLTALALALGFAAAGHADAPPPPAPDVVDTSFVGPSGQRTLQESIVIAAPVHTLWQAFVDPAQFKRWDAPVMAIDLRVGGTLEATYDPAKPIGDPDNIKHRILTWLPDRLLVFQNFQAPHGLPHADAFQRTVTVVLYEPLSPTSTRVTIACTGWANDAASNDLYGFFQHDNAELLEKMKSVYEGK